jgi:hypothetical protein
MMLDLGGLMSEHGSSQATVDSVAAEVNRLIAEVTHATSEQLPAFFEKEMRDLDDVLSRDFDGSRKDSIQQQLLAAFRAATNEYRRDVLASLEQEGGPLSTLRADVAARLQMLAGQQGTVLKEVAALAERVDSATQLAQERERGTAKGLAGPRRAPVSGR